jgi:hypothetical protein
LTNPLTFPPSSAASSPSGRAHEPSGSRGLRLAGRGAKELQADSGAHIALAGRYTFYDMFVTAMTCLMTNLDGDD